MSELPLVIQKSVRKYEKIETDGLTLFPILVKNYEMFLIAKPALEVLHQSLPVRFLRMPLLSALYQMDLEAAVNGETPSGLFSRAILILALALRLGEGRDIEERMKALRVEVDRDEPTRLLCLRFTDAEGEEKKIVPAQYQNLRQIIGAQNGVRIESDRADPDLVQAEKDLAEMQGEPLDVNIDDLISAAAALTGTDEADIEEWPILKLVRRQKSFQRLLDYMICGIGQVNGTTWKGGNPHPSPFFDRAEKGFGPHMALGDFAGGAGERAVASAGQRVN